MQTHLCKNPSVYACFQFGSFRPVSFFTLISWKRKKRMNLKFTAASFEIRVSYFLINKGNLGKNKKDLKQVKGKKDNKMGTENKIKFMVKHSSKLMAEWVDERVQWRDGWLDFWETLGQTYQQRIKKVSAVQKLQSSQRENRGRKRKDEREGGEEGGCNRSVYPEKHLIFPAPSPSAEVCCPLSSSSISSMSLFLFPRLRWTFHLPPVLLYIGNTRKPEKVEYFHPPIRFPLSSLR